MKYLSIDLETTGLEPKNCQILEIACILADTTDSQTPVENLPMFHHRVFHKTIRGEPYALWLNAELIKQMPPEKQGIYLFPLEIWQELANWLNKLGFSDKNKLHISGKNFGMFDSKFLDELPVWSWCWFRHRLLDPAMLYFDPLKDDKVPDTKECIKRAGLDWDEKKLHTAVDDARLVIHLLRRGFNVDRRTEKDDGRTETRGVEKVG